MNSLKCSNCKALLKHSFADLGVSPLANSYLKEDQLQQMEPFYPLHAYVCDCCYLVQVPEFQSPKQIFSEYAYFSSYSESFSRKPSDISLSLEAVAEISSMLAVCSSVAEDTSSTVLAFSLLA